MKPAMLVRGNRATHAMSGTAVERLFTKPARDRPTLASTLGIRWSRSRRCGGCR